MAKEKSWSYNIVLNFLALLMLISIMVAPVYSVWYFLSAIFLMVLMLIIVYANEENKNG